MSKQAATLLLALALLATSAVPARAFDGKRKGLILGVGLGVGVSSYTQSPTTFYDTTYTAVDTTGTVRSYTLDHESATSIATDFRIGWGINDQFLIYYDNRVNWFGITNVYDERVIIAHGLSALGFSYYFQPSTPSAFLTGGIGVASWSAPFEAASSGMNGFGYFAGGGWEFSRLLSLEATVSCGVPSNEDGYTKLTGNTICLRLMLLLMGY